MKLFDGITPGITVAMDETLGYVIALGEIGRGRMFERVKLDNRNPPSVGDNGRICEASVVSFKVGGLERFALTAPKKKDALDALVRVHTFDKYTRDANGYARPYWGTGKFVVGGHGAFGESGRNGKWNDSLWQLHPADALYVVPTGGPDKAPHYVLRFNGLDMERWEPSAFRQEFIVPWMISASEEAIALEAGLAEARECHNLADFIRGPVVVGDVG